MAPVPDPEPEPPILNIVGEKVALGPRRKDLLPLYQKWINDFEVKRNLGPPLIPATMEDEIKWMEENQNDASTIGFTIYEKETLSPIGNTDLFKVDWAHGTATFGLMIGEKSAWNKGYGTETTRLMMEYAFTGLGLRNVMLEVYSFNTAGIRAYLRAGFREIGRRRGAIRFGQRSWDTVLMDCTPEDLDSTALAHLIPPPD